MRHATARFVPPIAAAIIAMSLMPPRDAAAQHPAAPVVTAPVVAQDMAPTMWAPGTVVSRNDAQIAAEVEGRVTWIAEPGTHFDANEVIARLDDRSLGLALAEQEAQIAQLQARLTYNDRQVQRLAELAQRNSASKTQLDEITADRNVVSEQLNSARASRDRVAYDLERTEVRAPFGGQWVERHQQIGEYTSVGRPLGRLVDTGNKEVRVRAPITVAPFVHDGMQVTVKYGGTSGRHVVRATIPVGDEVSRSLELRVAQPEDGPLVGTAVRVAVPTERARRVIAVPRDALVIRSNQTYVQRVSGDVVAQTVVHTGIANGTHIEVEGNLQDGDSVVVRGAERLRDGQTIKVLDAPNSTSD